MIPLLQWDSALWRYPSLVALAQRVCRALFSGIELTYQLGRHGQNMQTGLFLQFDSSGGIDAVVDVCNYCADLIDKCSTIPEEARSVREKENMGIAHYFLRNPLIWFYHLASGKPIVESPQTLEILRSKSYPDFDPAQTIIRLRLKLLPVFKRFWEASWLTETSESVRKAIIFGLLAILKGEFEDTGKLPTSGIAPNTVPLFRRPPPVISAESVQQLTDMGFPPEAARTALSRARGDVSVATEFLLTNAHLFGDASEISTDEGAEDGNEIIAEHPDEAVADPAANTVDDNGIAAEPIIDPEVSEPINQGEQPEARDYSKELNVAREELRKSIVPTALRLADANPSFIDDIREVFMGPSLSQNSQRLVEDIKAFSPEAYDVHEIPLHVRCRILALGYLKIGSKGLGLSKEDTDELLNSLLALLLSGPVPGTPSDPVIPKWLASHMLLADRIICSGEDIKSVTIPKPDEEIADVDLFVGPLYRESRVILFDFCMRLAAIPDLPQKDDMLALLGVLAFLTKEHSLASEFVKRDGIALVMHYFKNGKQTDDGASVCMGILRHILEDPATVEAIMRREILRWNNNPRTRTPENIHTFMRALQPVALRDPALFITVVKDMCELTEANLIIGSHRVRVKEVSQGTEGVETALQDPTSIEQSETALQSSSPIKAEGDSELSYTLMHYLIGEMMQQYRQSTEQSSDPAIPGNMTPVAESSTPTNIFATPGSPSNTDIPLLPPPIPDSSLRDSREISYSRFVHNALTEMLLCYEMCKIAFLSYPRKKPPTAPFKDGPKTKPIALHFLLQEIMTMKGDPSDWTKKRSKNSHLHLMVVTLCADAGVSTDIKSISPSVVHVRKTVLETIGKALKEPGAASETTEQRYGRYIALGDLCSKLLLINPYSVVAKPQEDSTLHIAKIMLEKGFVSTFSTILSEVELNHPMSSAVTTSILSPLELL